MANTKVTGDLIASSTIATGNIADNAVTSDKISGITTAHITEGSNLYYTDARADARITAASTSDLSEGTNLYYTDARADARVALLVDSAPETLNTLNELADALGDDPNYAATTAVTIGLKAPLASPSFTGNAAFGGALTIDSSGSTDNYYLNLQESGSNRLTIYENNDNIYINGYAGHIIVRPRIAGSGSFAVTQGNTQFDVSGNATFAGTLSIGGGDSSTAQVALKGQQSLLSFVRGTSGDAQFFMSSDSSRLYFSHTDIQSTNLILTLNQDKSATFAGSVYAPDFYMNDYIYHNGDTNTYIRAQADKWTFRTGGDDRMHIDNTGVGIFTTSPKRTLDVRGNGLSIYGSGGNTELMLRGQAEGTGTVRNVGSWHWSVRGDVGGNNDDLKLLRFVTGTYGGVTMQIGNSDGVATFYSKIIAPQLSIQNQINTTSSNLEFNFQNGDGTTTNFKDFYIRDGKNGVILNIQGSSKISNFLGNVKITTSGYPLLDIGISSSNYFRIIHDNPGDRLTIGKNAAASLIVNGNGNTSVAGLLTPTSLDTNAYLSNGYAADLHGRYLGQAIYGAGTAGGDNYGTVADVFRYKDIAVWRKNSSTNAWSNPTTGNTLVEGNYAHKWGGVNMEPAYSEYIFYFSNSLGYAFLSQTIVQHSTNGNSFDLYLQRASSTTNPYDSAGWTTMVTQTGISSWPGLTCIQSNWEVGGGYPGLFRIRLVPSWNNGNVINIGSFQAYGSYGNFAHAWTTLFDRSVNFQSKIGVGTDPSRALDVTQTALIQGAGNVSAGTLALGSRSSGTAAWSTISGSHYNQSSGSGNGSGSGGIMMIGTHGGNGENDLYIGGGPYEINAATAIRFHTHTTDTSTAGGTQRMHISSAGRVNINKTSVTDAMLTVAGNSSNYSLNLYADSIYSGIYRYQRFRSGSNIAGGIEGSNQTSVQYVTTSDYRTKKNIKPLENGLDRVCKLKPVKFDWKLNDETTEGFIAHEVQDIFPEAVSGEKDGEDMQGMDYGRITPLLVKAIQEQQEIINDLKNRIETLENN